MTTHSSSTVVATSDVPERITAALRKVTEDRSDKQIARIQARIKDLEARGFIKRQEYSAPTTVDFERTIIHRKGESGRFGSIR